MKVQTIEEKIAELKEKRRAVILVHNYQRGEVQDIGDFVGDSLGLSQQASKTDADVIIFCGVHFMAETASIICPDKKVVMPDVNAGCPMANMITPRELRRWKEEHPDAVVVCYVNSAAEIKAMSDICCTSSNATKVVDSIPEEREVLFVPDRCLGEYVAEMLGRKMHLWDGYCPTHHRIVADEVIRLKNEHPGCAFVCHPECTRDVRELADHIASTSGIVRFARESSASEILVGTEIGIIHRLKKENPGKIFIPAGRLADCPNMKLTTLEKVLWALEDLEPLVIVPEEIANRARTAIERMLEVS